MNIPIIVPFVLGAQNLLATQISLQHENRRPHYAYLKGDEDYHDLIQRWWLDGEPFIINEHDIVAWPGAIAKIEECPSPWCTSLYRAGCGWLKIGLGLVKFDPLRLPNIWGEPFEDKHWRGLDTKIARRLEAHGLTACCHKPAVTNLNPFVWGAAVPHTAESLTI